MRLNNAKNRTTEIRQTGYISDIEGRSSILGVTSTVGSEPGDDTIAAGGKNSQQTDIAVNRSLSRDEVTGKLIRQLINETERQLAYHKTQVDELETRLKELQELAQESIHNLQQE